MFFWVLQSSGCIAAEKDPENQATPNLFIPSLFDPNNRAVAPDPATLRPIRFLTADDYPPFEFLGADGALAGYNIDLARALCEELKISCTIQPRRWDNLIDALEAKEGDAIVASLKETAATRDRARFTAPYYLTPARFVAVAGTKSFDARPEGLRGATIGVLGGSAQEAFLRAFFPGVTLVPFPDREQLMAALLAGQFELAFDDAIGLAIWINAQRNPGCCAFQGGPYLEPRFFGEGVGIGVRRDDDALRLALNWALQRLDERGVMTELYLKYFPVGIY
ncbi:transporter substrate-binding domain-containing protein [uncultured Rhodoblastus sp.]|uniref:transporter substrate-binding domain-containing protein n=1 Tax=uncultured Rhodoblastus sp. TaxID=543037 RepID=UPI0025E2DA9B|nr:transporter substrate-binding domain-containing protein [uncultured Rhodoblastus sp.]